jgi:hypothetical protein
VPIVLQTRRLVGQLNHLTGITWNHPGSIFEAQRRWGEARQARRTAPAIHPATAGARAMAAVVESDNVVALE